VRRFVVIGRRASASPAFSLADLPATSGRLDVLLRCLRAALLVSHGLRRDTVVYLVLLGAPDAPRTVRVDGASAKFVRPDERSLAVLVQKALAKPLDDAGSMSFTVMRHGLAVSRGGLDAVLADLGASSALHVLDEAAPDARGAAIGEDPVFFVGDHEGFDDDTRRTLDQLGATAMSVGPVSVHAEDAVALITNELDRRHTSPPRPPAALSHDASEPRAAREP
jgi:tRNA (pseudouridine54-N1)-methyltransferase